MDLQSGIKLPFNFKILPTDKNGIPNGVPFLAMFNPESLAISENVEWNYLNPPGSEGYDPNFVKIEPRNFSIDITLDGTGVNTNGVKIPVTAQVILFRLATIKVDGKFHRPNYLIVQYGLFICTCILQSSTVTYTMFDALGLPIRAKINASFIERYPTGLTSVLNMLSSPDLTHRVVVKEGDLLPLLTHNIYGNQKYYLQVAKANRLKNFRELKKSTTLIFPPLAKTAKK